MRAVPRRCACALLILCTGWVAACAEPAPPIVQTAAVLATEPVGSSDDAADDPALWLHPTDPARSLILGTNKKGGLEIYGIDGRRQATLEPQLRPNNIDVRYGIAVGAAVRDIAVASVRGQQPGLRAWWIDPATGRLTPAGGVLPVFGGSEPYGACLYRCARDGRLYAFCTAKGGDVEQWVLSAGADGSLQATRVRAFHVGSQLEGCVADDEWGAFFVAEEDVAIWRYGAEPDDPATPAERRLVAHAGAGGFAPDVEGLELICARDGDGTLIASMQGEDRFWLFDRRSDHGLRAIFDPIAGAIDDVTGTDGLCGTNRALGAAFAGGALICQDGVNADGSAAQNFKLFDWAAIAGHRLPVDPLWDPRATRWLRRD